MKTSLFQVVCIVMSVVMLAAGAPAWGHAAMVDAHGDAAVSKAEQTKASKGNCHGQTDSQSTSAAHADDDSAATCCNSEAPCGHEECSCVCPVMSHAGPVHCFAYHGNERGQLVAVSGAESPRSIHSTLLRPPRA